MTCPESDSIANSYGLERCQYHANPITMPESPPDRDSRETTYSEDSSVRTESDATSGHGSTGYSEGANSSDPTTFELTRAAGEVQTSPEFSSTTVQDDFVFSCGRDLLIRSLQESPKCGSRKLRRELKARVWNSIELESSSETDKTEAINEAIERLKFYKHPDGEQAAWAHYKRSFFTPEEKAREQKSDYEIQQNNGQEDDEGMDGGATVKEKRRQTSGINREEAVMGISVAMHLNELYSQFSPYDLDCALDVHSRRTGSQFENVDAIAADWQDGEVVELVSVEVKLKFGPEVVQQAANYCRFSHRVWIAIRLPQHSSLSKACEYLRGSSPRLFEYVVELGLGIIACRENEERNSYELRPVQWPRRQQPSSLEKKLFLRRYEQEWKQLGVLSALPQVH